MEANNSINENPEEMVSAGVTAEESIINDLTTTVNDNENDDTETDDIQFKNYCKQLLDNQHHHEHDDEHHDNLNSTYKTIPIFYHKLPKNSDNMAQKLREEARTLFLQKRSKELLDNNELKVLWGLLEKNYTMPAMNTEQFISYDDYLKVIELAGEKCK